MSTVSSNNQAYKSNPIIPYPIDATGSNDINQGDLVYFDTSAHVIKSVASDANAQYLAGVAMDQSYSNLYGTKKYQPQLEVATSGRFIFGTTSGDTYNHGDSLYIGADAQTITNQSASHIVGYAWMRPGQAAVAGGAGVSIDVLIAPAFPAVGVN